MRQYLLFLVFLIYVNFSFTQSAQAQAQSITEVVKNQPFVLTSEKTKFTQTGDYAEVKNLCFDLANRYPSFVKCRTMGQTAELRNIYYLVASKKFALTPSSHSYQKSPVVFVIAGTHAGEIDGKDAGFIKLREMLENPDKDNPLNSLTVVWIPVFNVDGHEHKGRFQRPNQDGPLEQGERTTARRINLNRDWMLAQSSEMKAMLHLVDAWDPAVLIDLHVTDGLKFRHDVSLTVAPEYASTPALRQSAQFLLHDTLESLEKLGHHPLGFYPRLIDKEDPKAGFVLDIDTPRNSHAYAATRNRIGILVEDYAWEKFPNRVKTCHDTLGVLLQIISHRSHSILKAEQKADQESAKSGGSAYALDYELEYPSSHTDSKYVDLLGYQYDILHPAPIVAGRHIRYHLDQPEIWHTPFYDDVQPNSRLITTLPQTGYVIPLAWAELVRPYLKLHGINFDILKSNQFNVDVEAMRVDPDDVSMESSSFQGRQMSSVSGHWSPFTTNLQKGSIFVPISQSKSGLVAHLLEPMGPDSLSAWGLFNTAYEISDYVANHRAFELVEWMYAGKSELRDIYGDDFFKQLSASKIEYDQKMKEDDAFRADPQARLDFWMSLIPPQDPFLNLYPIFRVQSKSWFR